MRTRCQNKAKEENDDEEDHSVLAAIVPSIVQKVLLSDTNNC